MAKFCDSEVLKQDITEVEGVTKCHHFISAINTFLLLCDLGDAVATWREKNLTPQRTMLTKLLCQWSTSGVTPNNTAYI